MTKRTRTVLFLFLGTVFCVAAPAIILYSQGYRLNFQEKWFSKVGAFYFQVTPPRAEVFINEKSMGQTARVLGSMLTKNFSPGSYYVRIQKEGYHSWSKQLEITEKQVTEAKHVVLLPQNPVFVTLAEDVQTVWFSPSKTEAIVQKSNPQNTWTLSLWDIEKNVEYPLYQSPRSQDQIWEIGWAWDSQALLLRITSQEQVQNFIQVIDRNLLARQKTSAESLQIASQLRVSLEQLTIADTHISFSPFQQNQILFLASQGNSFHVMQYDYLQQQLLTPLAQGVITFYATNDQVFWLDKGGNLWQKQSNETQALTLNKIPLELLPETLYAIHEFGNEFFLQENQTLYLLNKQNQKFEELFSSVKEIILSPDGKKLALSDGKEIWLYFLHEEKEQPSHPKGEKVFLTRFGELITNLTWLDAYHVLFARGNEILAAEIDNRDRLNVVELATFSRPIFFWHNPTKTLLVHTNNEIRVSKELLP